MRTFEADQFLFAAKKQAAVIQHVLTEQSELMNKSNKPAVMEPLFEIAEVIIDQPYISSIRNMNCQCSKESKTRQYSTEYLLWATGRLKILFEEYSLQIRTLKVLLNRDTSMEAQKMIAFLETFAGLYGKLNRLM